MYLLGSPADGRKLTAIMVPIIGRPRRDGSGFLASVSGWPVRGSLGVLSHTMVPHMSAPHFAMRIWASAVLGRHPPGGAEGRGGDGAGRARAGAPRGTKRGHRGPHAKRGGGGAYGRPGARIALRSIRVMARIYWPTSATTRRQAPAPRWKSELHRRPAWVAEKSNPSRSILRAPTFGWDRRTRPVAEVHE